MAPPTEEAESRTSRAAGDAVGRSRLLRRRGYLRLAAAAAVSTTAVGAASTGAAAAEYRTVTVPAGERRSFSVGSGETLENLLVDVSADGADAHISAAGNDWTVRNVGIRGEFDVGRDSGGVGNVLSVEGNGVVENVYLGDGHQNGVLKGAIGCGPSHAGHVEVRNVHVARWTGNAVYAAGPGRVRPPGQTDGRGGTLAFRGCYFANNNIAHLRIASDGTTVENCVFHNTNDVPPHPNTSAGESGVVNSRGIYTGYGDPSQVITVRNCDIELTSANTNGAASVAVSGNHPTYGELTTVRIVDSQIRGRTVGDHVVTENVGSNPDTSMPAGAPADATAAASGGTSSGGNAPSGSSGGGGSDGATAALSETLSIAGGGAGNVVSYAFEATGAVEKTTAGGASIDDEDAIASDGSVTGAVAGGRDSYRFAGDLAALEVDGEATVTLNGEVVDPASFDGVSGGGGDGTDSSSADESERSSGGSGDARILSISGGSAANVVDYEFVVSGDLEQSGANGASVDAEDEVSGSTATGAVAGGTDSYRYTGRIESFDTSGAVDVTVDGMPVRLS